MGQDRAAALLRAHGFDVRTDGLGNVSARVYSSREGTCAYAWEMVPVRSPADLLVWLADSSTSTA